MTKKVALRKTGLALASLFGVLAIGVGVVSGQNSPPGVGYGAIATDSQQNIAVGRSTTISQTKFGVQASSTASSSYALRVEQPGGSPIFWVRNDGAVSVPGSFTAGTFTGTMSAANVSAGQFGANTGGGNFMFPAAVDFDNRTHSDTLRIVQVDSGNWAIQAKKDWESFGSTILFPSGSPGATPYLTLGYNSIVTAPGQVQFNANGGSVELLVAENLTMVQSNPLVVGHWATTGGRLQVRANVGEQVRLEYTDNVHAQFTVDSVGRTTINTAGSAPQFNFTGGNVGVGTSTPAYPLSVNGTIFSSTGGFRFPDGTTQTTAATGTATLAAPNVSSGAFGANTGGGNYTFPASVRIGTSTAPTQRLQVDGNLALTSFDSNSGNLLFTDYNYSPPTTGAPGLTRTSSNGIAFIGDYASVSIQENKPLTLGWGNEILGNGSYQLNFRSGLFDTSPAFVFKNKANGAKLVSFTNSSDSERAYISTAGSMYLNEDGGGVYVGGGYASFRKQVGGSAIVESSGALNLEGTNIDIQAPVRISADHGAYIEYSGSGNTAMRLQHFGGFDGGVIMQNAAGRYIFRGAASQSANLTEWQNSSNTRLFSVSATGTIMFPDGSVQTTAFTGGASTISASNVSAGQFGANTGGGNYFFPASLGVSATPQALFHAGPTISDTNGLTFSNTGALIASTGVDQTASRTNVLSLMRDGTSAVIFAGLASFDMSRWSTSGVEPRAQLDIRLSHANTTNLVEVLSLQSSGKVGIGVTTPDATLDIGGGIANSIAFYPGNTSGAGNNAVLSRIIGRSNYGSVSNSQSAAEIKFLTGSDAWYKGQIAFFTNDSDSTANLAVERMRLSNVGYLGIATTSPQYPLSVNGVIFSSSGGFRFPDGTTQTTAASGSATVSASNVSAGQFGANTGGGNYFFPASLGIGATPTAALDILNASPTILLRTGSGTGGTIYLGNSAHGLTRGYSAANDVGFYTTSGDVYLSGNGTATNHLVVKNGGNVGIGFNAPGTKLDISADATSLSSSYAGAQFRISGGTNTNKRLVAGYDTTGNFGMVGAYTFGASTDLLALNPAGGNVSIGNTNNTYKLEVSGVIYSNTGGFRFPDGTTQTTAAGATVSAANVSSGTFGANTGGGNYTFPANLIVSNASGGELLQVSATGANRSRAYINTGSGIAGIQLVSNSNSWYIDNRGSNEVSLPANRLAFYSSTAGEIFSVLQGGQMVFGNPAMSANPNFKSGDKIVVAEGAGNASSSIVFASSAGTARYRMYSVNNGGTLRFEHDGSPSAQAIQMTYVNGATTVANQIAFWGGGGTDTYFNSGGSFGINTSDPAYPLEVNGVIYSSTGGFRFPDGTTQTTAATGASTMAAANVSSGSFGANTGGGNYTFPADLIVTSNLTLNAQTATRALAVDGSKNVVSSFGSASLMNSLTDETGSGVAVFGTSPVFTTNARISANAGMTWNSTGEAQKALDVGAYGVNPVDGIRLYAHDSSTGYAGWVGSIVTGNENSGTWAGKSLRIRVPDTGGTPIDTLVLRNGNVSIGNTNSTYKLEVSGVIYSNTGGFRFPDGTTQTTAATGGSTIAAANVSSGAFGANTGGGNYTFPGTLGASGVITSSGSNTNIGTHPSYGTGYSAFWRTSADYSLLTDGSTTYLNAPSGAGAILFRTANTSRASMTASQMDFYVPTYIYNMDYGLTVQNSGANHSRMRLSTGTGIAGFELISNGATWYIHHRGNNEAPANRLGFYNNAGAEVLTMASGGNVGIGNNNPGYKLDVVSGGATTARIGTGSGDTLTIGGGAGKINVGTVDPIYQIGNDKFATYMAGMIGVKEEVTGELAISCVNGRCEKVIDFGEEPRGSDLWLFGQVTDIDRHLPQASIILTPSFDGRVSYRKGDGEITIIATTFSQEDEVRVSYRFTAPRFDADKWGNTTDDPATSFTIEEK